MTTGPAPWLHCMLDVVSSEPVYRGHRRGPVMERDTVATHCCCARGSSVVAGRRRRESEEEAGMNSFSTRDRRSIPGFHPIFEAIRGLH